MAYLDDEIKGWSTGEWEVPEWTFDGNPALIINHMQKGIVGTGLFSGAPIDQEWARMKELGTIDMQKKLIAAFRERNLPVIFVSVVPNPIGVEPKWGFIYQMNGMCAPKGRLNNPELAEACEIIPEMGKLPEEPVFYHTGSCPLTGSHLEEYLRLHHVTDVVITGWTIHSTLYNTAVQMSNAWFNVVCPYDASGAPARDQECADIVINKMMRMWGLVTTTDDVIAHLPDNK